MQKQIPILYIESAYQKGIYRSRQELVQAGYPVPGIEETGGIDIAFNQPFHLDRVGVLYTRTFRNLKGITETMDDQISRVLSKSGIFFAFIDNTAISGVDRTASVLITCSAE